MPELNQWNELVPLPSIVDGMLETECLWYCLEVCLTDNYPHLRRINIVITRDASLLLLTVAGYHLQVFVRFLLLTAPPPPSADHSQEGNILKTVHEKRYYQESLAAAPFVLGFLHPLPPSVTQNQ